MPDLSRYLDRVTCGDCLDVLRELPDCSVDLCATDPPYALSNSPNATGGFMGKAWDAVLPARAIWAEVLRVLKPGASCFVCAGSRQDTILGLLTDLREVGFDIQHAALSWVYWNGFPKSTDVGKDFDKAAFLAWLREVPPGETETRQALMGWDAADVRKAASAAVNGEAPAQKGAPGNVIYSESRAGYHDPAATLQKHSHGTILLAALQARFGDAPGVRQKVGEVANHRLLGSGEGGYHGHAKQTYSVNGREACSLAITSPATPEAIEWDGWHSGSVPLKPSSETVLWVTKPAEPGPARANVLKWGTGAVNVGECRVPIVGDDIINTATHSAERHNASPCYGDSSADWTTQQHPSGRYPSNLLVSSRALGDDSKYGDLDAWARERGLSPEWLDAALSAGVLRVPKPSRSEKNAGCEGLEERPSGGMEGNVPGARETLRVAGDGVTLVKPVVSRNHHPTTKPTTLFAFLCTLACPRAGVVLDPFLGSGTTAVAAVQSGMHFIGIEREPEYIPIAEARVVHAIEQTRLGGLFAGAEATP